MGLITPLDRYCDVCGRDVDEGEFVYTRNGLRVCVPCAINVIRMSAVEVQADIFAQQGITVHLNISQDGLHAGERSICSLCNTPEWQIVRNNNSAETRYFMGRPVHIQRSFTRVTNSDGLFQYWAASGTVFMYLGSPWYRYPPAEYGKRSYYHSGMTSTVEPPF